MLGKSYFPLHVVFCTLFISHRAPYITTFHHVSQCGTIRGKIRPDTVNATEGLFGDICQSQNSQPPFHKCTKNGIDVKIYSDNKSPGCSSFYSV